MRLYIIRHADPDYELDTITEAGHLEAEALSKKLAYEGINKIYSSPMGRAQATASYTAKLLDIEPIIEDWTHELHGLKTGKEFQYGNLPTWNVPGEFIRSNKERVLSENWYEMDHLRMSNVKECYDEIAKKSDDFLKRNGFEREGHRYRIIQPNENKVALFCHNGFGMTWLAYLLDIPLPLFWSNFWLAPSSVTTILFDERTPGWAVPRCIGLCDVSHLYEAKLPIKTRGLMANIY